MADNSDVLRSLWEALETVEAPKEWERAPILDGWYLQTPNETSLQLGGTVSGSHKFEDGEPIVTSALRAVGRSQSFVITQNSVYQLGWPTKAVMQDDAPDSWPPVTRTAAQPNWHTAVADAVTLTGRHTLREATLANLEAAWHDDGSWEERRDTAHAICANMQQAGRMRVAEAWFLLATDLTVASHRHFASMYVTAAFKEAGRMHERTMTGAEKAASDGWERLGSMPDDKVVRLARAGLPTDDPIAAAHRVAQIAASDNVLNPVVDNSLFVTIYDGGPQGDGVVVLREVGGTSVSTAGREVRTEFRKVLGKPLPLAPVRDLDAAERALRAEFPHAIDQIHVVLSDLAGAAHFKVRPTLFVGDSGSGKSRLVRRFAESLNIGMLRFDGAGSADNAFGGTPRRWSSGEHSTPFEAVRRHMIANPIVFIDEIDKGGRHSHNGSLEDAVLPFLESETARAYPDPYIQSELDLSYVSYLMTANRDEGLSAPLRDRVRIIRLSLPGPEHMVTLCRSIVADIARDRGGDPRWWPPLEDVELAMVEELWPGGSVRKLRSVVERIVAMRERFARH